jgi:hypothetical protein
MKYVFKDIEVGEFFKDDCGFVWQKDSEYRATDRNGESWSFIDLTKTIYKIVDPEDLV